jgi:hypothetical protein
MSNFLLIAEAHKPQANGVVSLLVITDTTSRQAKQPGWTAFGRDSLLFMRLIDEQQVTWR